MRLSEIERFWSKVKKQGCDDCWLWIGYVRNDYGRFWIKDRDVTAHRYSYELEYGKIPVNIKVCHKCDNPSCVNPKHLFLGSQKDNVQDMFNKKRNPDLKGEKHGRTKLKNEQVLEIRSLYESGCPVKMLATNYGVSTYAIYDIISRKNWAHI